MFQKKAWIVPNDVMKWNMERENESDVFIY